jgi:hypothetical protein
MRVVSGKVVGGKVVVQGAPLNEGSSVTVVVREDDETFELGPEDEAALVGAIDEADGGDVVPADEVLGRLRRGE